METSVTEHTANTRGFIKKITVKNQMLTVSKDRDGNDKPVPKKKYRTPTGDCFKIQLDSLSN
jgi:hypothetical protein